ESRFVELVASASRRVTVSTVTLEDDALVEPSTFVDLVASANLPQSPRGSGSASSVFTEEILSIDPVSAIDPGALDPDAREWLAMRLARSSRDDPAFHGQTGPTDPFDPSTRSGSWSVSARD